MHPVHYLLACSNVLGMYTVWFSSHFYIKYITILVMFASTMMHLSETKHNLKPSVPFLYHSSNYFLNVDRMVAVCSVLYLTPIWWHHVHRDLMLDIFILALLVNWISEQSIDLFTYTLGHLFWHMMIYLLLSMF